MYFYDKFWYLCLISSGYFVILLRHFLIYLFDILRIAHMTKQAFNKLLEAELSTHLFYRTITFFIPAMLLMALNCQAGEFSIDSEAMVKAHNEVRSGVGSPKVKWSETLEAKAIKRVKQLQKMGCVMKHSEPGENLFWASAQKTANKKNAFGQWIWHRSVQKISEKDVRNPVIPPWVNPVGITRNWSGKTRVK